MTWSKSLVGWIAILAVFWLTGCSVQKRTTTPGWHVEKRGKVFRQAVPSSSLTPAVMSEPLALQRMNRIPPRALAWKTRSFPADTLVVDAKLSKQVTRALRREIRCREQIVMFPRGLSSGAMKCGAERWRDKAEQRCKDHGQFLSEVAPDEFARAERLCYPDQEVRQDLKGRKIFLIVLWSVLAAYALVLTFLIVLVLGYQGG